MTQLIDDQLLGVVLRGGLPPLADVPVATTGLHYFRLCQAVLASRAVDGVLSAPFNGLPTDLRQRAMLALIQLPEELQLVSLRDLAPLIGRLRSRHDLNLLGMELLAASIHLDAEVFLSAPSPRLEAALRSEGRFVELVV